MHLFNEIFAAKMAGVAFRVKDVKTMCQDGGQPSASPVIPWWRWFPWRWIPWPWISSDRGFGDVFAFGFYRMTTMNDYA
jgi:hypothetical protein